jgi:arsenate reductase-like glutaredoxin family protein
LLEKAGKGAFEERDLSTKPMTAEELDRLIGKNDYIPFLNARNELYRERNMKENPPARAAALKLMAAEPNLIKRPLLVTGREIVYGFDEAAFIAALKREGT